MSSKLNRIAYRRYKREITRPYIKTVARIILIPAISLLTLYILYIID
ncbi:MAG TPA: hypothetical protein PLI11_01290 [Clostridia bacterium]|jgi:hypothetical protein|nr:hypothetical protein [Clostridiaceae bacterium]HOA32043.1 hypothetical protein [Clostridia bacterium]HPZ51528.1 hypothetical protein [Clostridia bacterium]